MAIAPFPHRYSVNLDDHQLTAAPRPPIMVGAPSQFGGQDDVWSPEHLLMASVLTCLKTTFEAFARRDGLAVDSWHGTATGILEKARGGPVFTSIDLEVEVTAAAADVPRVEATLATAEHHCLITRALSAPVRLTAKVAAAPARAVG